MIQLFTAKLEVFSSINFLELFEETSIKVIQEVEEVALNMTLGFVDMIIEEMYPLDKILKNIQTLKNLKCLRITCWKDINNRKEVVQEFLNVLKNCKSLEILYFLVPKLNITETEAHTIEGVVCMNKRIKSISFNTGYISIVKTGKKRFSCTRF